MFYITTRYGYWFCFYDDYACVEYRPAGLNKEPDDVSEKVQVSQSLRNKLPADGTMTVAGFNGFIDPWLHTVVGDELFKVVNKLYDYKDHLMHC